MTRVRISTTVDGVQLARCRSLLAVPDSQLVDRALRVLAAQLAAEREIQALAAAPYEADSDLAFEPQPGPDLPYDGEIPLDVSELAAARRRRP